MCVTIKLPSGSRCSTGDTTVSRTAILPLLYMRTYSLPCWTAAGAETQAPSAPDAPGTPCQAQAASPYQCTQGSNCSKSSRRSSSASASAAASSLICCAPGPQGG